MHYKIFCSGADKLGDDMLHEHGLGDLCRDTGASWEFVQNGPGDQSGTVGTWKQNNPQLDAPDGIPPDFEWTPIPKTPLWIGINPKLPPGPMELRRRDQLPSVPLELADGRTWQIPIARGVPHTVVNDEDGEPLARVDERFQEYSRRAFEHASLLAEREEELSALQDVYFGVKLTETELKELCAKNFDSYRAMDSLDQLDQKLACTILFSEGIEQACDALSINYRVNRWIVCHLQLLRLTPTENHVRNICLCAFEANEIAAMLKKKDLENRFSLLVG